ncbi:MAG: GrpB family protein [Candidatus Zixiibacteriota bacterium]
MSKKKISDMNENELGKLFPIIIESYNPKWPQIFADEKITIEKSFADIEFNAIYHIGSTAIEGISAKPTIDMILEIPTEQDIAPITDALKQLDYHAIPRPDKPMPSMMYAKGYTPEGFKGQAFHIHLRYPGEHKEIIFRDYLRKSHIARKEYEALKMISAIEFRNNREKYTNAKTDFILKILEKAKIAFP